MESENNNYLISYKTLRQLIGVLGILLPFLCWGVNTIVNHAGFLNNPHLVDITQSTHYVAGADLKRSISHFYYTTAGPLFTGILITVAIFLLCYKGYPKNKQEDRMAWITDSLTSRLAAIFALGIVFFPTDSAQRITDNIYIFVSSAMVGNLHLGFATLFFLSMAVMTIVNFRRQPGRKFLGNAKGKLFLVCGWGIIACILILTIYKLIPGDGHWLRGKFTYVMESFMLLFFGVAWLVKGKSIPTEFLFNKLSSPLPEAP